MRTIISFTLIVIFSCTSNENTLVTNDKGHYSIISLPEWTVKNDGVTTKISKTKYYGTDYVTGTVTITEGLTDYKTLDETFDTYLSQFQYAFKDFRKINEGRTQINGLPTRWFRMTDNVEGTTYETVQYVIQLTSDKVFLLNCSATKDKFTDFEEEFNKIVFSYKRLD